MPRAHNNNYSPHRPITAIEVQLPNLAEQVGLGPLLMVRHQVEQGLVQIIDGNQRPVFGYGWYSHHELAEIVIASLALFNTIRLEQTWGKVV